MDNMREIEKLKEDITQLKKENEQLKEDYNDMCNENKEEHQREI